MGIAGHMLGEKKLRKLQALTGLPLDRAYIRNTACEGRTPDDRHWEINLETGAYAEIARPMHWTSCADLRAAYEDAQESIRRAAEAQMDQKQRERIVLVLSGFEIDVDSCEEIADAIMAALKRESA